MFDFLTDTLWADWAQHPLPGDASARRFTRLTGPNDQSVMVMQTPADDAQSQHAFVHIAQILNAVGLIAPEILHQHAMTLVLTDLGTTDMAQAISRDPAQALPLYECATDVLLVLHRLPAPDLHELTPQVAGDMVRITAELYADHPAKGETLAAAMQDAMARLTAGPATLALRDFHAENLIWRPGQDGTDRMGLLDFQDAFAAPAGYDLVSLLRDARRDVPQEIYDAMITRFCLGAQLEPSTFHAQAACLGAQRNLRILGVFARLARQLGKRRYVPMIPRVWQHLQNDLAHPALVDLRDVVADAIPTPETAVANWGLT